MQRLRLPRAIEWGGPTAWKVVVRGDLVTAYHWINDECYMVLFPRHARLMGADVVPYALRLEDAHTLVVNGREEDGRAVWARAERAAASFGREGDPFYIRQIACALVDGLEDLLDMPPQPRVLLDAERPVPTGEVAFTVNGKPILEAEV